MGGGEKITNFLKETQPLCFTKLSNVLFLYELVEEKLFKYISEYISADYNRNLDDSIKTEIAEFLTKTEKESHRYPQVDCILRVIKRFVIRCLVATLEPKFPIKEYLIRVDFWDINIREELIDNFYFDFPDNIFISNTLSLLEFINDYIKSKSDDSNLDFSEDKSKFDSVRQELFKKQNKYI